MNLSAEDKVEIQRILTDFEAFRKKKYRSFVWFSRITKPFKIVYYIALPCLVISGVLPFLAPLLLPPVFIAIGLIIIQLILYNAVFKQPDERFYDKFKTEIMPLVFQKINPELQYSPYSAFAKERVTGLALFQNKISSYGGEDLITGKFNGVPIEICEVTLYTKKHSVGTVAKGVFNNIIDNVSDNSSDFSKEVVFFNGLLMEVDFHKAFEGQVFAVPRKHIASKLFKSSNFNGQQKTTSGNTDFDAKYVVYSNDDVLLHYLLTPALLEKFLKLGSHLDAELFVSLINGQLNIGVNWNRDLFECDFKKGIPSIEEFIILSEEINLFEEIVIALSQERRIWGEKALQTN